MYKNCLISFMPLVFIILFIHNVTSLSREAIAGGHLATEFDNLGYQVFIRSKTSFFSANIQPVCGGAIIHEAFLLSGARCFVNKTGQFKERIYHVIAGTRNLNDFGGINIQVDSIYTLASFNWSTYANDISVIKLRTNLSITGHTYLSKLKLFKLEHIYIGVRSAIVSGYGYNWVKPIVNMKGDTEYLGSSDNLLRYAYVRLITNQECALSTNSAVLDEHVCGQIVTKNRKQMWGVCIGDGGGPLVYANKIIAILSAIEMSCVDSDYPAKYTRVFPYLDFIENVVNGTPPADSNVYINPLFYDRNVIL